jgi:ABC-type nitrate/sulfonate/bicarbonate transport system permease component
VTDHASEHPGVPVPPRPHRRSVLASDPAITVMSLAVFLGLWTYLGTVMNPVLFGSPVATWERLVLLARNGSLWQAWSESLLVLFVGLGAAALLGVGSGVLLGRVPLLLELFSPGLAALFMTPGIALVPLISLWLGWADAPKILLVLIFAFFPVYYTTLGGIRSIDAEFEEISAAYSVRGRRLITQIVLPAALPFVITALRLGMVHGMVAVVLGGFFLESNGIGGLIHSESSSFRMASVFAVLLTVAGFGVLTNEGLQLLERRLVPWKAGDFA